MKKAIVGFVSILVVLFIAGGVAAVMLGLEAMGQIFISIFPFLTDNFIKELKEYLTYAYFIVGLIIFIGSTIGFTFSVKERKVIYGLYLES